MAIHSANDQTYMLMAIEDTLRKEIHESLKKPLMKFAEEEIDKAVAQAVDELKISMEMYRNMNNFREELNILYGRK